MGRGAPRDVLLGKNAFPDRRKKISRFTILGIGEIVFSLDEDKVISKYRKEFLRLRDLLDKGKLPIEAWRKLITESNVLEASNYRVNDVFHPVFRPGKSGIITERNGKKLVHTDGDRFQLNTIIASTSYIIDRDDKTVDKGIVSDRWNRVKQRSSLEYGEENIKDLGQDLYDSRVIDSPNIIEAGLTEEFREYAFLVLPKYLKVRIYG